MKKILPICVSLIFIGCSTHNIEHKNSVQKSTKVYIVKDTNGNPPIPEVHNINYCLRLKTKEEKEACLKRYDKGDRNALYTPTIGSLKLASRGGKVTRKLDLSNRNRLLIHIDITHAKETIYTNISNTIIHRDSSHTITIDINVKDIQDSIIIYDGDDKELVEYKIIK